MFAAAVELLDFMLNGFEGEPQVILRPELCVPPFKSGWNARLFPEMGIRSALAEIRLNLGDVKNQIPFGLELRLRRFVRPRFRFLECCAELFGIFKSGRIVGDAADAGPEILRRVQTRLKLRRVSLE